MQFDSLTLEVVMPFGKIVVIALLTILVTINILKRSKCALPKHLSGAANEIQISNRRGIHRFHFATGIKKAR